MLEDLKMRTNEENGLSDSTGSVISASVLLRAKQMQVLDLERNILQVRDYSYDFMLFEIKIVVIPCIFLVIYLSLLF